MNLFNKGENDVEVWCNHGLKRDQRRKEDVRALISKLNVLRDSYRV